MSNTRKLLVTSFETTDTVFPVKVNLDSSDQIFYHELKTAGCDFELVKEVTANYRQQRLGKREVNFFVIGDLLLSVVAVQELDDTTIHRFWSYIKHVGCRRGLIVNFHATVLDFRYLTV